ncbi:MAG: DegV family protein, partial [Patescibacteria group bacterium]
MASFSQGKEIGIVADDVCSLPRKIIDENEIGIVNTKLSFPGRQEFPGENLYKTMERTKAYPKTSAPSPGDFIKVYKKSLEKFKKIIVITLSSRLSGTYNSAFQAREFLAESFSDNSSRIELIDSQQAVAGEGLLVLKAIDLIERGKSPKEIKNIIDNFKKDIKMIAFLKSTFWVEKIGRM